MAPAFVFVPPAGFEANAELRPAPRSFVIFFTNNTTAARPAMTAAKNDDGFPPAEMAASLSPAVFRDALPAWHRVPKMAAQQPGRRRGTIMKRPDSPYERWTRCPRVCVIDRDTTVKEGKLRPARRRRLHGGLWEKSDVPEAQFALEEDNTSDIYTEAIVRTIDHLSENPSELFQLDPNNYRFGGLKPVVREKRRHYFEVPTRTESNDQYYNDLMHLVVDLWCHNGLKIKETAVVERMFALQTVSNDTRKCLAAQGVTDLSTIMDATEPDTTYEFNPPNNRATSLSAAERKARLSAHMPSFGKSVSPLKRLYPAADTNDSAVDGKQSISQEPNNAQALRATETPNTRPGTYGLFYSTDTSEDGSSIVSMEPENNPVSPAQRPGAPTPSRWNRPAPTTPARTEAAATPSALRTPGNDHVDLSASLRASGHYTVETTPKSWKKLESTKDVVNAFTFADTSREPSSFIAQHENLSPIKVASRRRSEPLLQTIFRDRASRTSLSPQKFFAGPDRFDGSISTTHATPARSYRSSMGTTSILANVSRPLDLFFGPRTESSPVKPKTPTTPARYEIDCKENPDIFGKKTPVSKYPLSRAAEPSPAEEAAPSVVRDEAVTPETNGAVKDLAKLASNYCDSEAKVFVTAEDGKLKVRFKLPMEYATLFPNSQGTEASQFSSVLEVSDSPPIRFPPKEAQRAVSPERMSPYRKTMGRVSPRKPLTGSPLRSVATSIMSRMNAAPVQPDTAMTDAESQQGAETPAMALDFATASERRNQFGFDLFSSTIQTPTQNAATPAAITGPKNDAEQLPMEASEPSNASVLTPTTQLQHEAMQAPDSAIPDEPKLAPSIARPTVGNQTFTPSSADAFAGHSKSPSFTQRDTPSQLPSELGFDQTFATASMGMDKSATEKHHEDAQAPYTGLYSTMPQVTEAETMTPLKSSFTPVNKPASQRKEAMATASKASTDENAVSQKTPESQKKGRAIISDKQLSVTKTSSPEAAAVNSATQSASKRTTTASTASASFADDHAKNRDFLEDFVSRTKSSKAKNLRTSTTDSGSPVAAATVRQPLGAKSPNASPSPRKRKSEDGHQDASSPPVKKTKKAGAVASKPPKRPAKGTKSTARAKKETVPETDPYEVVDEDQPMTEAPDQKEKVTRRSTRISKQPAPKSSIPMPIQVGSYAGAGRNNTKGLTSVGRNDQAELTRQTSQNTRRNKFKADNVFDTLARVSEEKQTESEEDTEFKAKPSKSGKNVAWSTPLESFQQTPKKGKKAPKPKATMGKTGVTKPKATPTKTSSAGSNMAAPKRRSQAATNLGMAGNGTPARPNTRAKTRSQQ